jgi:hypothetical protein
VVTFRARTSVATEVAFDPSNCDAVSGATTVQGAIDALCGVKPPSTEAVKILEVSLAGDQLLNDSERTSRELAKGIRIVCNELLDQASVRGKPVCYVTLDMPWPVQTSTGWGDDLVGFQPIVLDAAVNSDDNAIFWGPTESTHTWLNGRFIEIMLHEKFPPVLAHLTVKGNFVWAGKSRKERYLDGETFGRRRGRGNSPPTDVVLPSGDDRPGGNFEMWFRVGVDE